jgi:diguanylate cyclase
MSKKPLEYYSEALSPVLISILKHMADNKVTLSSQSLNKALQQSPEFEQILNNKPHEAENTSITNTLKEHLEVLKGFVREEEIVHVKQLIDDKNDVGEATDALLTLMRKQIVKNDRRLSTLTEFVESLFKKVLTTQDKMSGSLEQNLKFVEEDLNQDKALMSSADEVMKILQEEGIVFPSKPFQGFMEAFDSKVIGKQSKLESMTEDYTKIEQELMEYKSEVAQLNENIRKYRQETITDHLTGLNNRKYMDIKLNEEIVRNARIKQPFCVLMLDIDDFKKINDVYGHIVGDQVIKHLSSVIKTHVRKSDFSFRYGGEEFLVLLLNTDIENAIRIAEQIRQKVETTNFTLKDKQFVITVTIGVAQHIAGETVESLIERADKNLYNGKRMGKNVVKG